MSLAMQGLDVQVSGGAGVVCVWDGYLASFVSSCGGGAGGQGGHAGEGAGDLAGHQLAGVWGAGEAGGAGVGGAGSRAARCGVDPGGQLSRVAVHRPGCAVRGRGDERDLHHRLGGAGRVHRQRQRDAVLLRGERGAARQDPTGSRPMPAARQDLRLRHGGAARLRRSAGDAVLGTSRSWARVTTRSTRGPSTGWSRSPGRTTWRSSSTPRAPRGRPKGPC